MEKYTYPDPPSDRALPIANAGWPIILAAGFTTLLMAILDFKALALLLYVFTMFSCYFFRDPDRLAPEEENAVVSPADGKVIFVNVVDSNPFIEGRALKISIFMSVFNVHVNRNPMTGTVKRIIYNPGRFFRANLDKASLENEHNAVVLDCNGREICYVQIAGLVARRILCGIKPGDMVVKGERFGMIRFGSRLDVYLPVGFDPCVLPGDKVFAGSTVIGNMSL
ncbi:phosphatidylserine decarboxylase [Desulfatibacillum alkenivorans DSM 16219]|jgi:phosphatidylserine decarboxylase|uniref:Phosphatidylserine decarboxylase proenzyme n=1 Tax=Desulfatibacillum alkenivorans DSM 16219 TaxID=1121393 RepID=A0A1M7AM91_9BACT|nr:phosphatidylserine decarboxylase family protein [Desulfatibacillum alkenivorans]SHL43626.1 phosphatidylserine decarboxylase [Desulfatibacillum alkenivorans DSM 16219]